MVDASGLDPGEVENVVDQIEEMGAAGGDRVEGFALLGRQRPVSLEELGIAEHPVQRRAKLVAHVGEELALGLRRGLGRFLGAAELFLALREAPDSSLTGVVGHRRHDQVRHREREIAFVGRPRPAIADVLDAHDADGRLPLAEWHVEHRANPKRCQIPVGELARAGIFARVVGHDEALAFERVEVRRRGAARQHGARFMAPRGPRIEVGAADGRAVVVEAPHADPLGLQRLGRDLEQLGKPGLETWCAADLVRGELGERRALLGQPLLARSQRLLGDDLIGDVGETGQDCRFAAHGDERGGRTRPARPSAPGPAELQQQVVGAAIARQAFDERRTLTGIDVEVGDAPPTSPAAGICTIADALALTAMIRSSCKRLTTAGNGPALNSCQPLKSVSICLDQRETGEESAMPGERTIMAPVANSDRR